MSVPSVLAALRARDIQVQVDGDRLRCNAPRGAMTAELRGQLEQYKPAILEFLRRAEAVALQQRSIVPLQPFGTRTPVFALAGHLGDPFCYQLLVNYLGKDQPFFGLQPPGLDGLSEPIERVEDLAAHFAEQILAFRPEGPYIIAGYCAGGAVALELARQLQQRGATVSFLALFGCLYPTLYRFWPRLLNLGPRTVLHHIKALAKLSSLKQQTQYVAEKIRWKKKVRQAELSEATADPLSAMRSRMIRVTLAAARRYKPRRFSGPVALFMSSKGFLRYGPGPRYWQSVAPLTETCFGPDDCHNDKMLLEPHASVFAEFFIQFREKFLTEQAESKSRGAIPRSMTELAAGH